MAQTAGKRDGSDNAHAQYAATEHYGCLTGVGPKSGCWRVVFGQVIKDSFMSQVVLLVYRMPLQPRNSDVSKEKEAQDNTSQHGQKYHYKHNKVWDLPSSTILRSVDR